jgi:hypothetical protein
VSISSLVNFASDGNVTDDKKDLERRTKTDDGIKMEFNAVQSQNALCLIRVSLKLDSKVTDERSLPPQKH